MKKISRCLILCYVVVFAFFVLTSCYSHFHTYSTKWSFDDEFHYHNAICEHLDKKEKIAPHILGDWVIVKEATEEENGEKLKKCSVCGYEIKEVIVKTGHIHNYGSDWFYNKFYHYKGVYCGHFEAEKEKEPHTFVNGECRVCKVSETIKDFSFLANKFRTTYSITKYSGNDENVIIPSIYEGYPVVAITNEAFKMNHSIKSVVFQENLTSIGGGSFDSCRNLKNIVFPKSLREICQEAFSNCVALTHLEIPGNIKFIGSRAFALCSNLKEVKILDGVTTIESEAFFMCENLGNVYLSNSLESIADNAFKYCYFLKSIIIPKSVKVIKTSAFWINTVLYCEASSLPKGFEIQFATGIVFWYSEQKPVTSGNYWRYDIDLKTPIVWQYEGNLK